MLISVHLPKTAGSSFARTLEDYYGNKLLRDYTDFPINQSTVKRTSSALENFLATPFRKDLNSIECIHGHYLPIKYQSLSLTKRAPQFVTWLREPVERLISHYHFWDGHPELAKNAPLHQKFLKEKWSLERFCLSPELRNIYKKFLWGVPARNFSFIGITEFYNTDLEYFSRLFLDEVAVPYEENVRSSKGPTYDIENTLRKKIEQYHRADVKLYREACLNRLKRIEQPRF